MKVTAQDVAQLLASPPPREVPGHVVRAAQGGAAAWSLAVFGLVFGGIGVVLTAVFFSARIFDDWTLSAGAVQTVPGVVTAERATSLSVNKRKVWEYDFRYTPEGGGERDGRCYLTGSRWHEGAAVVVEYLRADPRLARIRGTRLTPGGASGLFVLLFPAIGAAIIVGFFVHRRNLRRVVCEGRAREVDVLSCEAVRAGRSKRTIYRFKVAHPTDPGALPVDVAVADSNAVAILQQHVEQKRPIYALYDPDKPTRLVFPETLVEK